MAAQRSQSPTQELSADNIQIQVNINGDKTIKLNVRPVHTVTNVLEFLSASTGVLPNDVKLLLNSEPLNPSSTVGDLSLSSTSTLELSPPVSSIKSAPNQSIEALKSGTSTPVSSGASTPTSSKASTPRKNNKPRCSKQGCKAPAQPIVGDCGFCQKRFCGKHRMLESHNCEGLEDARQADKDRNAAKLEGERTVMLRGL